MNDNHEIRDLQYRLKQANKQLGKQGETIHRLRCELHSLIALTDPDTRAQMQKWLDGSDRQNLVDKIHQQALYIDHLRGQIDVRRKNEAALREHIRMAETLGTGTLGVSHNV
jgi:hypothetical protein